MTLFFESWHVGRKKIIAYLRPYLDLPENPIYAWQKVKRWRRRYSLVVETQPNGKPYIDEDFFRLWWIEYLRLRHERLKRDAKR
ncbi:MAG: hypothetical protein ACLQDF_07110 [Desulfomonilia bacterium]